MAAGRADDGEFVLAGVGLHALKLGWPGRDQAVEVVTDLGGQQIAHRRASGCGRRGDAAGRLATLRQASPRVLDIAMAHEPASGIALGIGAVVPAPLWIASLDEGCACSVCREASRHCRAVSVSGLGKCGALDPAIQGSSCRSLCRHNDAMSTTFPPWRPSGNNSSRRVIDAQVRDETGPIGRRGQHEIEQVRRLLAVGRNVRQPDAPSRRCSMYRTARPRISAQRRYLRSGHVGAAIGPHTQDRTADTTSGWPHR